MLRGAATSAVAGQSVDDKKPMGLVNSAKLRSGGLAKPVNQASQRSSTAVTSAPSKVGALKTPVTTLAKPIKPVKPVSAQQTTRATPSQPVKAPPKLLKTLSSLTIASSSSSASSTKLRSAASVSTTRPNSIATTSGKSTASVIASSRLGTSTNKLNSIGISGKSSKSVIAKNSESLTIIPAHVDGEIDIALMISKNNPTPSDLTPHESAVMLQHATHIRLDRSNIETLNGITHFQAITHLHIQYNFISSLKPLANLPHLRILCAEGNLISRIEGLNELQELKLLDVSKNLIQEIEIEQLPQSLENFLIKENPCTIAPDYRLQLIYGLKELSVLDEVDIGPEEKRLSKMRFGDEQERLDAITWNPETENEEENETEETNSEKEKKEEIMSGDAEVFSPVNDEAGGEDRVVSITIDLEPFKSTVDAILERSRIRQAESVIDNRIRMDELIAQMRASGKARTERLKKVIASLN